MKNHYLALLLLAASMAAVPLVNGEGPGASAASVPALEGITSFKGLPHLELLNPAALKGSRKLEGLVSAGNYKRLGLKSKAEASQLQLAQPIRHYFVQLDKLRSYSKNADPSALLEKYYSVSYPLAVGTAIRSSVGLAWTGKDWKVTSLSSSTRIQAWDDLRRASSTKLSLDVGSFFTVRIMALNQEFLGYYDSKSKLFLIPQANSAEYGFVKGESLPAADVFMKLQPAAAQADPSKTT